MATGADAPALFSGAGAELRTRQPVLSMNPSRRDSRTTRCEPSQHAHGPEAVLVQDSDGHAAADNRKEPTGQKSAAADAPRNSSTGHGRPGAAPPRQGGPRLTPRLGRDVGGRMGESDANPSKAHEECTIARGQDRRGSSGWPRKGRFSDCRRNDESMSRGIPSFSGATGTAGLGRDAESSDAARADEPSGPSWNGRSLSRHGSPRCAGPLPSIGCGRC